ncbi:MAG: hypothetical protein JWN48_6093 [Myxococcaceae bacterium]|nr:hypothetical protein [Myxococcaceae bacterium]
MLPSSLRTLFFGCALMSMLWLTSSDSQAQQSLDDERAKAHFFAGESHFAAERWADAEREFALAYDLSHRPEMLINLSRAQERNGELPEAIASLELLLTKHPDTANRSEAESRIAAMRKQLAERPPEPAPVAEPEPAPVVEVAPEPEPAPVELPPVSTPPEPPARRGVWPPSLLTLGVASAAVVTAVVSLGTGLSAHHGYNDLEGRCPGARCSAPYVEDRDHGRRLARTSTAFTFVSVALAGGAAVLWVYDVKRRDEPSTVSLGIDGAGARMRARF